MKRKEKRKMKWTGEKIRSLREAYDQTQEEFAEHFGVSDGTVSYWERAMRSPRGPACKILDTLESQLKTRELQSA